MPRSRGRPRRHSSAGLRASRDSCVARQHFSQAADRYLELHERGVRNAELYRSLGNAALLADRWPEAIWAYQLGLELDPNDAGLRDGLAFARVKVLYPPGGEGRLDPDSWPAWLHRPTRLGLFFAFAGCYALACLAGTCAWLGSRASLFAAMILGLAALAAGAGLWQAERRARNRPRDADRRCRRQWAVLSGQCGQLSAASSRADLAARHRGQADPCAAANGCKSASAPAKSAGCREAASSSYNDRGE